MKFFLFVILVSGSAAAVVTPVYVCTNVSIVPDANLKPISFPKDWDYNKEPPRGYAAGLSCEIRITIPANYYIILQLKSSNLKNDLITITDSAGTVYREQDGTDQLGFFGPSITVRMRTLQQGAFSFIGVYAAMNKFDPISTYTQKGKQGVQFNENHLQRGLVISADTRVSVVPFYILFYGSLPMMLTAVYDGPSINSKYLGSLYSFFVQQKNVVSKGTTLTLQQHYRTQSFGIAQDYSDVSRVPFHIGEFTNWSNNGLYQPLDASKGSVAFYTVSDSEEYINSAVLDPTSSLSIYAGTMTASNNNRIAQYKYADTMNSFPQKLTKGVRVYVMEKGTTIINLRRAVSDDTFRAFGGRKGFIVSGRYPFSAPANQSLTQTFVTTNKEVRTFTWTVQSISNNSQAVIAVSGGTTSSTTVVAKKGDKGSAKGTNFNVRYDSSAGTGLFLTYTVSSSSFLSYSLVFLISLLLQ